MKSEKISIKNVRALEEKEILLKDRNLIHGKNGSGKTTVLESLFLALTAKSFRTSNISEVIRDKNEYLFISTKLNDEDNFVREVSFGIDRKGSRKIVIDGDSAGRKQLLSIASIITHTPEDVDILRGGPKNRRDFLDRVAFIEDRDYFDILFNYSRYLKHKLKLLKTKDRKSIKYLNIAAVKYIDEIRDKRKKMAEIICDEVKQILDLYMPDFKTQIIVPKDEETELRLEEKLEKEIEKGHTLYGPHLDNITVKINKRNSRTISMGEVSFISIIIKLSELVFHSKQYIYPIFCGDDIFSFLDESRVEILLDIFKKMKNQIILTSTEEKMTDGYELIEM